MSAHMSIHLSPSQVPRPRMEPFWAAALKGTMTYAFTHGEFSLPPSRCPSIHLDVHPSIRMFIHPSIHHPLPERHQRGPKLGPRGPGRPGGGPGRPYPGPGKVTARPWEAQARPWGVQAGTYGWRKTCVNA